MTMLAANPESRLSRNQRVFPASAVDWSADYAEVQEVISGTLDGQHTHDDTVWDEYTESATHTEGLISVTPGNIEGDYSYTSETPEIGTVTSEGRVEWVSNRTAQIAVSGPRGRVRVAVPVSSQGGQDIEVFNSFAAGSLSAAVAAQIDGALTGKTPNNSTIDLFSTLDHDNGVYARNTNCWAYGFDLTCMVVRYMTPTWKTGRYGGTLITPRHYIQTGHAAFGWSNGFVPGTVLSFVTNGDVRVDREVVNVINLLQGSNPYSVSMDVAIGVLDSDVPGTITPAKIPTADLGDYLPSITPPLVSHVGHGTPFLFLNQFKDAWCGTYIRNRDGLAPTAPAGTYILDHAYPVAGVQVGFQGLPTSGDSGHGGGFPFPTEFLLTDAYATATTGSTYSLATILTLLNQILDDTVPGYSVSTKDLSGWTNYA